MRRYLSTLHKRSNRHKQNFALLVSGGVTLTMFSIWFMVNHSEAPVVAQESGVHELAATKEVSPFESLTASVSEGWQGIGGKVNELFDNLGSVNVEQGYNDMKTETMNTYGR